MNLRRCVTVLAACLAALGVASCATTSGATLSVIVVAGPKTVASPPPPPPAQGLEVITLPDQAAVYLDDVYRGATPLVIAELSTGSHILRLSRMGYYDVNTVVTYAGSPMVFQATLTQITGIVQLHVTPADAQVMIEGQVVSSPLVQLPLGSYSVLGRAFGYQDFSGQLDITGTSVVPLDIQLQPAPFDITDVSLVRRVINPGNPGVLGSVEASFRVSGPGEGSATVLDSSGAEVSRGPLALFTTWNQRWTWRPASSVPDGDYRVVLSARGSTEAEVTRQESFTIDRTVEVAPRSGWNGSAGLLYAPTVDTLASGSWQASLLLAAGLNQVSGSVPAVSTFRLGLAPGAELDLLGGFMFTSTGIPLMGSAALRWELVRPSGPIGMGIGLDAKLALQAEPPLGILTTDTFANFSGVSIGVPVQITLGPVSLLAEAAVIASPWQVDYSAPAPAPAFDPAAWLYGRAGLLLDAGPLVAGLSASARTGALPAGIAAIDLPLEIGGELHYLVADTHLVISAIAAVEVFSPADWRFYAGGGLGLIY